MDGRFKEQETGAEYFVRELSDGTVAWVGEHVSRPGEPKAFTNVFLGRRVSTSRIQGDFIDVPKGLHAGFFPNITVEITLSGYRFGLPESGTRTLIAPDSEFPSTDFREWGAGFYDETPDSGSFSLTGVWRCNDGGTYYIRQVGNRVVWFGEHPSGNWSNIFFGRLQGGRISGRWVDVPKGGILGNGEIELTIDAPDPTTMAPGVQFTRTRATGGFGGSRWFKTDSVRLAFRLLNLRIVKNADVGGLNAGGDEPYLMPLYVTIGGNQYTDPTQLLRVNSGALPLVVSPLFQHEWGTTGDWPKNNLTWQEDLAPGTMIPIPDFISYAESELRTLRGFQPNSRVARQSANFIPGVIAMEEASTRNDDIRAGYNALLLNSPLSIHREIVRSALSGTPPNPSNVVNSLTTRVIEAIRVSAMSDLFGILSSFDPDKAMGTNFPLHSLGTMRDAALRGIVIPVDMTFRGGAGGEWLVTGTVSASLGPARFNGEITELEITFETGDDDKRGASSVNVSIRLTDGTVRGPFHAHNPGQKFADRSLQIVNIPLTPSIFLGSQRELLISWGREPGDGFRQPDSWELRRIRVVAFDRFNRRQVLLRSKIINTKFENNRVLSITLPSA